LGSIASDTDARGTSITAWHEIAPDVPDTRYKALPECFFRRYALASFRLESQ
jgi:hypothetical protein